MARTPRLAAAIVCLLSTSVCAQNVPTGSDARRDLLLRASEASLHGDHAGALRLGEEAARIQISPWLQMFFAEEHELLASGAGGAGHLVDAVTWATACARDAAAQPALNNRDRILQRCGEVASRLNPRVARVRITAATPAPEGLRVRLGDRDLPPSDLGAPLIVLPGEVVVEASAPEHEMLRRTVQIAGGATETVTIALRRAPAAPGGGLVAVREPPRASATRRPVAPIVGWSLVGAGVVAGAVGAWQWAVTSGQSSDTLAGTSEGDAAWRRYATRINSQRTLSVEQGCERASADAASGADPDATAFRDACEANERAVALAYGFGIGGMALALGGVAVLVLTRRGEEPAAPRVSVAPVFLRGYGGVTAGVTF